MTDKEKFIALIDNDRLKKSDAIILLEGDGYNRVFKAVELYKNGWAKKIVVSGNFNNPSGGSYPATLMKKKLLQLGIPAGDILIEDKSLNTREQAVEAIELVAEHKWRRILLVASPHHQYRAYLTFLKAMEEWGKKIEIINASAVGLFWFTNNRWGRRINLLDLEFKKIDLYKQNGHITTYQYAIKYQAWKEKR